MQNPLPPELRDYARALLIHEDGHILVFNKPAGLAVQGGSGVERSLEDLLAVFAKSNGKRPRLVHRLDRETSGVIVAARTKPAAAFLSEAFASRDVKKTYLAIVCGGSPDPIQGEIDKPLQKVSRHLDRRRPRRRETPNAAARDTAGGGAGGPSSIDIMEISPHGQAALTRYRTLSATQAAALLQLEPETGRMHQLRAHLASIGHPIAGDGKYGGLFSVGAVAIPSLMLHAAALEIPHPEGGRRQFEALPPPAFQETLRSLGLENPARG